MKNLRNAKLLLMFLAVAFFVACGGAEVAGNNSQAAPLSYMLSWEAPQSTVNDESLNPVDDLSHYELYVNSSENFSDADAPVAFVSVVGDGKKLVTEFDLALLNGDDLPSGELYVSLRAVGVDGQKSDFMSPVSWIRS